MNINLSTFCVLFFVFLFSSCKSSLTAQQKKDKTKSNTPKISKPKFGDVVNDFKQINPNTIEVEGMVVSTIKLVENCNNQNLKTIAFKINKKLQEGQAIQNHLPIRKKIFLTAVQSSILKSLETKQGMTVKLYLKEKLCINGDKSFFQILSFSTQENSK